MGVTEGHSHFRTSDGEAVTKLSMIIGTVKEIWRHPVKSMAGEKLDDCTALSPGMPGDRGWALRDEVAKEITNGKQIPMLMQCAARYREEPRHGEIPHVDIVFP